MGVRYRVWQFWKAIQGNPTRDQLIHANQVLNPELISIFLQLQASEQVHSLSIFERLIQQGDINPDLLTAALLHDVGKACYPLHAWERALVVIGRVICPNQVIRWGQGEPKGWKRTFVVAEKHPAWGAEMAAKAGASTTVVDLIRQHQRKPLDASGQPCRVEDQLLHRLQLLDDQS